MSTFNRLPIEQQLKTMARLGAFDVFVDALDETVCQQIGTYVERRPVLPTDASGFPEPAMASVYALAGVDAFEPASLPWVASSPSCTRPSRPPLSSGSPPPTSPTSWRPYWPRPAAGASPSASPR
jgi:hypothetical protein